LHFTISDRSGWLEKAGFLVALFGIVSIIVGDVGEFWLGLDNVYIMMAPAYRSLRLGLSVMAAGAILFGVGAGRGGTLPVWGVLPFTIGALCGLISVFRDLGNFGAVLWTLFGVGWAWLGLALFLESAMLFWRSGRREPTPPSQ
jgi:hypothetical protein